MTTPTTAGDTSGGSATEAMVRSVARGGVINLASSLVYGVSSFVFLVTLGVALDGAQEVGVVLVTIAAFTVASRVAEMGCTTGLVRTLSAKRATGRVEELRAVILSAVVPVAVVSVLVTVVLMMCVDPLARLWGKGGNVDDIRRVLLLALPFLPFSTLQTVVVQGTRGFDRMVPLAVIEKIGRSGALPIVVLIAAAWGSEPLEAVVLGWALLWPVSLVAAIIAMFRLVREAERAAGVRGAWLPGRRLFGSFWSFTLPRAAGQTLEVSINWFDTLLIAAVLTTTEAGVYAAGTRYLLIGTFTAEAIGQSVGPRVSGLIAGGRTADAAHLLQRATGWSITALWPVFLSVLVFAEPLLTIFGDEVLAARPALMLLAVAVLVSALNGPAASVILMSGRSRTALFNAVVAVTINLVGNLLLVPEFGITAAGAVWAASLIVMTTLPAIQARRNPGVSVWTPEAGNRVFRAILCVVPAALIARWVLGPTLVAVCAAAVVALAMYIPAMRRFETRGRTHE